VTGLRILCRGATGVEVSKLQSSLIILGYNPETIDGIFGAKTASAVSQFQKDNGLFPDEIVGPITWGSLQRLFASREICIIRPGDTFYQIARAKNISLSELLAVNERIDPYKLMIGQVIRLPKHNFPDRGGRITGGVRNPITSEAVLTQIKQNSGTPTGKTIASKRLLTDMAGRTVSVPCTIKTAFASSPGGSIMLYALCPDKMIGWNNAPRSTKKKYILPKCQYLPGLGGWYAKKAANREEILRLRPEVIIDMGDITPTKIANADNIQQQLGIPLVLVDAPLMKMDKACEFVGVLLGEEARAQELAAYCRNTIADVEAIAALIAKEKLVSVYYAEGAKGLDTEPDGSKHIETLSLVRGINVAKVALKGGMGMSPVSQEQILFWNPEVILAWGEEQGGYYKGILSDSTWQGIKAVQQKRVYQIPNAPFNWLDRPPSINRMIGLKWLGNLLYPDVFDYNMVVEVKEFYAKFYHYHLSDEEAQNLLAQVQSTK
jgi:iron complex transport system substrate-binding protein